MAACRAGSDEGAPHEILDPRDLKFCRNRCSADWAEADDPFRWRERIPFARWGLAELLLMGVPLAVACMALGVMGYPYWIPAPGVLLALVVYFFRDPTRAIPEEAGLVVSPAEGTIDGIMELDHHEFIGGPAVRISIFLSIFNVHLNRAPARSRVIGLTYRPGRFLNAMNPESSVVNESMQIDLEEEEPPHRRVVVRQVSGLIARRIVCDLRPGEVVDRGHKIGMIKLGSRTELFLPAGDDLQIVATMGQKVRAGSDVLARFGAE